MNPIHQMLFQSGFEPGTLGVPAEAHEILTGADRSVAPPNDWDALRRNLPPSHPWASAAAGDPPAPTDGPRLGYFDIQYLGGTAEERFARIVEDPTDPGNRVLHFWILHPNERYRGGAKARVQASLYRNRGLTAVTGRVRMYLHPDLEALRGYEPGFAWCTLQELWFGPSWEGGQHPFRISLGLHRDAGAGGELHFCVHGQPAHVEGEEHFPQYPGWGRPTWEIVQRGFDVPTGVWIECETQYRMGDATTGRFAYRVRPAGGEWTTIFDVSDWTYNPRSPAPVPLTDWNPMKLYTSAAVVGCVRDSGGATQVFWDDLAIWGG